MKLSDKKILITEGAGGIGFGPAEQSIKDANTVIMCGRKQETHNEAQTNNS